MAEFAYSALSPDGRHISGVMTTQTRAEVITALRDQGNKPLIVKESAARGKKGFRLSSKKVKLRDMVIFTREL